MRGSAMSSAKSVCPMHLARASTLRKGLPTTLSGFPFLPFPLFIAVDGLPRWLGSFATHSRRREFDRFINLEVAGAAAEIARQSFFDLLARRLRVVLQQFFRHQQEPRRAITALRRAEVGKGFLQWMKLCA